MLSLYLTIEGTKSVSNQSRGQHMIHPRKAVICLHDCFTSLITYTVGTCSLVGMVITTAEGGRYLVLPQPQRSTPCLNYTASINCMFFFNFIQLLKHTSWKCNIKMILFPTNNLLSRPHSMIIVNLNSSLCIHR